MSRDTALAKTELQSHLSEIRMMPTEDRKKWYYVAVGNWKIASRSGLEQARHVLGIGQNLR